LRSASDPQASDLSLARLPPMPRKIQLNEQQQLAVDFALKAGAHPSRLVGAIKGAAGTGKTVALTRIADLYAETWGGQSILFAAPTHKACGVLGKQISGWKTGVEVVTVARLTGVSAGKSYDMDAFGQLEDRAAKSFEKYKGKVKTLIVDESSMVKQSDADLLDALTKRFDINLIFTGDEYQLPPVKVACKDGSDDGEEENLEESEFDTFDKMCSQFITTSGTEINLTKVVRQKPGPLLRYATEIRQDFKREWSYPSESKYEHRSTSYEVTGSEQEWFNLFVASVKGVYKDKARAVAWKNANVDYIAKRLRQELYGDASQEGWLVGERIVFPKYTDCMMPLSLDSVQRLGFLATSYEAEITESEFIELDIEFPTFSHEFTRAGLVEFNLHLRGCFQMLTLISLWNGSEAQIMAPCMDCEDAKASYREYAEQRKRWFDNKWNKVTGFKDWAEEYLYNFKRCFPSILPINVGTVHKSQGSSFHRVFIYKDLEECKKCERNPLIYVASTRPTDSAFFLKEGSTSRFLEHHRVTLQSLQSRPLFEQR
jgi:hypothetical protein